MEWQEIDGNTENLVAGIAPYPLFISSTYPDLPKNPVTFK
jgi:hypothetical protein